MKLSTDNTVTIFILLISVTCICSDHHNDTAHVWTPTDQALMASTEGDTSGDAPGQRLSPLQLFLYRASQMQLFKIGVAIQVYYTPIVCCVGLVGNFLSATVMFQKHNRRVSCCVYMGFLAITDSLSLGIGLGWYVMDAILGVLPAKLLSTTCKVVFTAGSIIGIIGVYIILAMTFDRLMAVKFPLKALSWCSPKRARRTTAVIVCLSILFKIPYIWVVDGFGKTDCTSFRVKNTALVESYYWINTVVGNFLPFLILLILNILIIKSVTGRGKFLKKDLEKSTTLSSQMKTSTTSNVSKLSTESVAEDTTSTLSNPAGSRRALEAPTSTSQKENKSKESSLTAMLLLVTFAFLFLTSPLYMFYIVYLIKSNTASSAAYAEFIFTVYITSKLFQTNNAINFYLYYLGGTKFRKDLWAVISKIIRRS